MLCVFEERDFEEQERQNAAPTQTMTINSTKLQILIFNNTMKQNYLAPEVAVVEVAIEVGFAGSDTEAASTFGFAEHEVVDM